MVICIVCGITDQQKLGHKTSFHSFPKDPQQKRLWIEFIKNATHETKMFSENSRICRRHFHHTHVYKKHNFYHLSDGAVPTITSPALIINPEDMSMDESSSDDDNDDKKEETAPHTYEAKKEFTPSSFFNFQNITSDPKNLNYYTGLKHKKIFDSLFEFFVPAIKNVPVVKNPAKRLAPDPDASREKSGPKPKLCYEDQFLLTLMRLRLYLPEKLLGDIFGLHQPSVSRVFNKWILVMSQMFQCTDIFPSHNLIDATYPTKFKNIPSVRIIIDATEIQIEHSSSLTVQKETWSQYKSRNTVKGIIGISPQGQVVFISRLYGGRISDKKIVIDSKILDLCEEGDGIMVDRGFTISDECDKRKLRLIMPHFLGDSIQFSSEQVKDSREIASLRFEVERIIGKTKNFKILHSVIPLSMSAIVEDIWFVCNYLCNFTSSVPITSEQQEERVVGDNRELRRILWPVDLCEKFLSLADDNTTANIETMGLILAKEDENSLIVSDLVLPLQTGTSESCVASEGLDLSDFTKEGRILIGWIHTHPTQTSFMSSLDLHTQQRYQGLLKEFVAVVCAPSYQQNSVFRINEPYGMAYIQNCLIEDRLHDHSDATEILYTLAEHTNVIDGLEFAIHDFRGIGMSQD